jgi:hypothetical protein
MLPFGSLGVFPMYAGESAVGHGLPWRVDDAWALTADIGPLLLGGFLWAFGIQALLGRTDRPWAGTSFSLALVAAVLLALPTGPLALVILVVFARHDALRDRMRLTRRGKAVVAVAALVLAATSLAYAITHPLTAQADGTSVALRNEGRLDVRVHAVDATRVEIRIPAGESVFVQLPQAPCGEQVRVRMSLAGREVDRTVWLDQPVAPSC